MDALETGRRIQALRKRNGWTQKDLAERLCVTDKSVSKWERGLNYPDMAILEPLAKTLNSTVVELLGIENIPEEEKVDAVTAVAVEETERLRKETCERAIYGLVMSILVWIALYSLGHMLIQREIYDLPLQLCSGLFWLVNFLIGNFLWMWWKHQK